MASIYVIVMGSIIGALAWIFLAFKVPGVPFGRTLGTFGCAVLTLVFCVLSPADAFASINIETLALLFGTMVISVLLEREGFFQVFIHLLTFRCTSAYSLLVRVCVAAGLLSALMTNDTVCVFFTPVIVELCELHQLPHGPFLIALATSANIGSTATPVGNPQNMIIASLSGISYGEFIIYIGPATLVVLALNIVLMLLWYGRQLKGLEVKVCRGRFFRATEEEMEAQLGKDWEREVALEVEREQRRLQRRERERTQAKEGAELPPPADEADDAVEMDDLAGIKRRKGAEPPSSRQEEKEEEKGEAAAKELRVDVLPDPPAAAAGGAQQAQVMVRHGQLDEKAKDDEDERKAHTALSVDCDPSSSSSSSAPPLLHSDSVAVLIYQLQMEHRALLQADDTSKKGAAPIDGDDTAEDAERLQRRRTRTRVADAQHPRKRGRRLVQLPPELSAAALARLEQRQWRRRMHDARKAGKEAAKEGGAEGQANGDERATSSSSLLQAASPPPSSLSVLQPYLPSALYLRLLLLPLPSKLLLFFLILVGTIGAFAGGLNLGWSALGGACLMLVLDWRDPDYVIGLVDWSLLVFFTSLFIVTQGFQATGIPLDVWTALQGTIDVDTMVGLTVYTLIVLIGSNTVSNVPLVLLLGPTIPTLSSPFQSWLLLSFVSTVAGNLTLVGSVANLIVASRAKASYHLTFWELTRFGFPSTLLVTVVGVAVIKGICTVAGKDD